jgi:hypothetical protein
VEANTLKIKIKIKNFHSPYQKESPIRIYIQLKDQWHLADLAMTDHNYHINLPWTHN